MSMPMLNGFPLKGQLVLLQIGGSETTTEETWDTIGGARINSMGNDNPVVDVTTRDTIAGQPYYDSYLVQALRGDAGPQQVTIEIDGLFEDAKAYMTFEPSAVNTSTDRITVGANSPLLNEGWKVRLPFQEGVTRPAPLDGLRKYVRNPDADSIQLSNDFGGAVIDITTQGVGTQNIQIQTAQDRFWGAAFNPHLRQKYRFVFPSQNPVIAYEGEFIVTNYLRGGGHDGAETFRATMRQSAPGRFTPI